MEGVAMKEPEINPPLKPSIRQNSWPAAYREFVRSPSENRLLKLMPLVLIGIVPISALDDLVIPIFGTIDDIPTTLLTIITLVLTGLRVRKYR
jgi:hypothetical protein